MTRRPERAPGPLAQVASEGPREASQEASKGTSPGGVRAEHVDLAAFRARDRFDVWQGIAAPFFDVRSPAPGRDGFAGSVTTLSFGEVIVVQSRLSGQAYERDARRARVGPWDQMAFQLYCSGSFSGDYDGRDVALRPGDIDVIDFTRPYSKASTDEADINLIVPRALAQGLCPGAAHGDTRAGGTALGRLLGLHLSMLAASAPAMTAEEAESVVRGFLLVLAGASLDGEEPGTRAGVRATARARAERFIRANLHRADMDVDAVARGSGLSRAALYRVFAADGGVRSFVLRARLDAALEAIRRQPTAGFETVAEACGLGGRRQLARLLRQVHGLSPDDLRDGAIAAHPAERSAQRSAQRSAAAPEQWLADMRRLRAAA